MHSQLRRVLRTYATHCATQHRAWILVTDATQGLIGLATQQDAWNRDTLAISSTTPSQRMSTHFPLLSLPLSPLSLPLLSPYSSLHLFSLPIPSLPRSSRDTICSFSCCLFSCVNGTYCDRSSVQCKLRGAIGSSCDATITDYCVSFVVVMLLF